MSTTFSCPDSPKKKERDELYYSLKKECDEGDERAKAEMAHYYGHIPEKERGWFIGSLWPEVSIAHGNDKLIIEFLGLPDYQGEIKVTELPKYIKRIIIYLNTRTTRWPVREAIESTPGKMVVRNIAMDKNRARSYLERLLELFTIAKRHNKSVSYS